MNRVLRTFIVSALLLGLSGCGAGNPDFAQPTDNQVFTISQNQSTAFAITLTDPTLSDAQIEVRIPGTLVGRLTCSVAGPNGNCFVQNNVNPQSFRTCSEQLPCQDLVTMIARRGDKVRAITITIRDIGFAVAK